MSQEKYREPENANISTKPYLRDDVVVAIISEERGGRQVEGEVEEGCGGADSPVLRSYPSFSGWRHFTGVYPHLS